jgi:hypothetical protein
MKPVGLLSLTCVIIFGACATTPAQAPNRQGTPVANTAGGLQARELTPQNLPAGTCGMFLWSMGSPRRFVFFSEAASSKATAFLNDRETTLTLVASRGDVFGEFLTEAEYRSADGMDVRLSILPGEMMENGQRVSSGNLVLKDLAGWETVLPVAGLRACMPAT